MYKERRINGREPGRAVQQQEGGEEGWRRRVVDKTTGYMMVRGG